MTHHATEPVDGRDEVGRLSASFGRMLGRMVAAREAQERLVHDAAHELRTPLTSLLANATVLHRVSELSPDSRDRLLDDVRHETRELGHLVDELVELALAGGREEAEEPVDLAEVARRAARRVYRRSGRLVHVDADGSVVRGRPQGLERAVGNLLENAAKFDADGDEPIEVRIRRGAVTVRDRGPASPPTTRVACSTASTGPTALAVCPVPDSASPSSMTSRRPTAAPCRRVRGPAVAPRWASR